MQPWLDYGKMELPASGANGESSNLKKNSFECRPCHNKTKISQIHIPYAAKLLFQELASMNIATRLYTKRSGVSVR